MVDADAVEVCVVEKLPVELLIFLQLISLVFTLTGLKIVTLRLTIDALVADRFRNEPFVADTVVVV
jgi:hypothetical protein